MLLFDLIDCSTAFNDMITRQELFSAWKMMKHSLQIHIFVVVSKEDV